MSTPQGTIYLLNNVPLTASYEHTIDFKNRDDQYSYFMRNLKKDLSNYSYIRKEREYIIAELSMAELDDINYMIFRSSANDRLYYAFVTDKIYVNDYTTQLFYELDLLQTYQFDYKWQPSYIKQAHVDRWTAEHKPIYSKTEEALNYGTEYMIESGYKLQQDNNLRWLLVTIRNPSELLESGSTGGGVTGFAGVNSPFRIMLIPFFINWDNNGEDYREIKVENNEIGKIETFDGLVNLMQNTNIGDFIISISLLLYNPLIVSSTTNGKMTTITLDTRASYGRYNFKGMDVPFLIFWATDDYTLFNGEKLLAVTDWDTGLSGSLPTAEEWEEIKRKPYTTKRDKRWESKLLCSPYRYNILSDWRNAPTIYKNEYLTTDKIEVNFTYALSSTAPFRFWIKDYKRDPEGRYTSLSTLVSPEMPIISDAYYRYMLENKNTIQANLTNSIIGAASSTLQGAISGAAVGGVWGAVGGAATGLANGALNISAQIRSENAKQADLKAHPDTIINSTDSSFNINDKNTELTFYRMRLCCENENIIANIFNMTGYTVNRVEVPNTRSRTRFNYIQTLGANIIGSFNQKHVERIKAIYDKGVTIWHYSEKDFNYLDYSYENIEVNLL